MEKVLPWDGLTEGYTPQTDVKEPRSVSRSHTPATPLEDHAAFSELLARLGPSHQVKAARWLPVNCTKMDRSQCRQ